MKSTSADVHAAEAADLPRLVEVADGVWQVESTLRVPGGARLPIRMTVLRLEDGGLLLHSPIKSDDDLARSVEALGTVRALLAPNAYHHLMVGSWKERYPAAQVYGPRRLTRKRPDLRLDHVIEGGEAEPFGPSIQVELIAGAPKLDEIAVYHRPSRTLVVADLLFNVRDAHGILKWVFRVFGTYQRTAQSRLIRLLIRDRKAYRHSLDRLRALAIDRLIMSHGDILEGAEATEALGALGAGRS